MNKRTVKISTSGIAIISMLHGRQCRTYDQLFLYNSLASCLPVRLGLPVCLPLSLSVCPPVHPTIYLCYSPIRLSASDTDVCVHDLSTVFCAIFRSLVCYVNVCLLKDIPSTGLDLWTELKARSERLKVEGQLHLRLSLATREERDLPEDERQFETKQHCDLITIFIDYELRKSQVSFSISLLGFYHLAVSFCLTVSASLS